MLGSGDLTAPHIQALLLVANSVDSNADCTRLVVDGWLELELRVPDEALKVLSAALTLRAEWERLLAAQLGQSGAAEGVQGVSRKLIEKLSDGLVRYLLYTEVQTRLSCLLPPLNPFPASSLSPALLTPLRPATACGASQLSRRRTCTWALGLSLSSFTPQLWA